MTVHSGRLALSTRGDTDIVDITDGVQAVLRTSGMEVGTAVAFVTGSTAALTTMEYEPGGVADLRALLDVLAPARAGWAHNAMNHDTNAHCARRWSDRRRASRSSLAGSCSEPGSSWSLSTSTIARASGS